MNTQLLMQETAKHRTLINEVLDHIWKNPETGYREWKTSAYLEAVFEKLGYTVHKAETVPGFYADLDTGRPGPKVLVLFELDALLIPEHPEAVNGVVHACGHHAQCAAGVGVAATLSNPETLKELSGSVRFMAVPAEEMIELPFREELRKKGIIRYFDGKSEFLSRGYMNGVDVAFMLHTTVDDAHEFSCRRGSNGCIVKTVTYTGHAAHAGGSPDKGINALYAAMAGLNAVNALRETFRDEDHIRVHPILTEGGQSVNIIPAAAEISSYVRGANMKCITTVNQKVNRAFASGALALGCTAKVNDRIGFMPLLNDPNMMDLAKECMTAVAGTPERVAFSDGWSAGSTDMGALCVMFPSVHPYASGASGTAHGKDYRIASSERACVASAQAQVLMIAALLENGGQRAKQIRAAFKPQYASLAEYLASRDTLDSERELIEYHTDNSVTVH